jgi:hypothetical protein
VSRGLVDTVGGGGLVTDPTGLAILTYVFVLIGTQLSPSAQERCVSWFDVNIVLLLGWPSLSC